MPTFWPLFATRKSCNAGLEFARLNGSSRHYNNTSADTLALFRLPSLEISPAPEEVHLEPFQIFVAIAMTAFNSATTVPDHQEGIKMTAATTKPSVILVHGTFADASSWASVIERLQVAGIKVMAVSNHLHGLKHDGDYVASVANQITGPVVLVGHSYSGPVITHAGSKANNVKGLVYISSFGLDKGTGAVSQPEAVANFILESVTATGV
jgi:pimeloyl-ACP methyl ester carboxylesterase